MMRRNPLDPDAHARDPHPTALARGRDDRRGVHTTPDKLTAIWYAMVKASHSPLADNDTGVLLQLDCQGLEAHPDFDAEVERKHTYLRDLAYLVGGEFELDPDSERDHERLISLIEGDLEDFAPEHLTQEGDSVLSTFYYSALGRGEGNQRVLGALLEMAEGSSYDAGEIIETLTKYYKSGDREDLPLTWFAYAMQQWRYFVPIGFDRVVRVEVVQPWNDYLYDEELSPEQLEEAEASGLPFFVLSDTYDMDASYFETVTVYAKKSRPGARLEWHGTNLSRARAAFPRLASKIVNPWNTPFIAVT